MLCLPPARRCLQDLYLDLGQWNHRSIYLGYLDARFICTEYAKMLARFAVIVVISLSLFEICHAGIEIESMAANRSWCPAVITPPCRCSVTRYCETPHSIICPIVIHPSPSSVYRNTLSSFCYSNGYLAKVLFRIDGTRLDCSQRGCYRDEATRLHNVPKMRVPTRLKATALPTRSCSVAIPLSLLALRLPQRIH